MILKKQKISNLGLSLIEMLVGMFILLTIGLAVFLFQRDVFSLHKIISTNLTVQYEARFALKNLISEIRSASPSNSGAYPIAQAATSTMSFYVDLDEDSLKERVRYFLEGTTLKKGVIKPSGIPLVYDQNDEVISESVHNVANATTSIFSYFDNTYDGSSPSLGYPIEVSSVRLVGIYIVIDEDIEETPRPLILTTQVTMRNLKDNL